VDWQDEQELVRDALEGAKPGATGWARANCPLCVFAQGKEDKQRCLSLNAANGWWHCFRCMCRGRLDEYESDSSETVPRLPPPDVTPPECFEPLWREPGASALSLERVRTYLRGRGVPSATWRLARIGVALDGPQRNRIIVPVMRARRMVGWVARDWTGNAFMRYIYPQGMARGSVLYCGDLLTETSDQPVLVVEGVFDALPYYGDAVACLGKPSAEHFEMLAVSQRPLLIALDGDAHEEGWALAQRLRMREVRVDVLRLPAGEDPNTAREQVLKALRSHKEN